ncbi:binding-protein-dependent transport systems inner membrane component [Clostridium sp. CAG:1013]|jgi:arabinosaccharide transport system permease protein|nr:binding-protein-dependent transport systems inner membrane component [Clostridium sp. CAG:1013]
MKTEIVHGKSQTVRNRILSAIMFLFFLVLGILVIIPFYANFISSFKPGRDIVQFGLNLGIDLNRMSFDNYVYLFTGDHYYFRWFFNSMGLTIVQVFCVLMVCAFVGYGFACYNFKGRNFFFTLVLLTMMVPFEILMLPLYTEIINMKLTDSWVGIILPGLTQASTIFFFRQYLLSIPKEIMDAGRVDGSSEYGIYFRLIMPIMKPSFAAMAILNGMNSWNSFLWPLLVFRSEQNFTLPIGLRSLLTPYGNNYDLLIVGSFFSVIPLFILFLAFQRYFLDGMTAGAVKG